MALIQCPECNARISSAAKVCPQCGKRLRIEDPARVFGFVLVGIVVLIVIAAVLMRGR